MKILKQKKEDNNMESVIDRFLRYVKVDTQSSDLSDTFPSTVKQSLFLELLKKEMIDIGLDEVIMDEYGYVMGTIPSTVDYDTPVIGFIAHVDTAPDFNGENVKPQLVQYQGGDIVLNDKECIVMKEMHFPELAKYKGMELITTDGTTLLGADDKAGVAEIMTAAEYLMNNTNVKHGKIRIGFTPDEEIGRGVDFFDVNKFGAKYAYTIDGSHCGELEYENFNAAIAKITIQGRSVHPGYAKDKMINALNVGSELHMMLPVNERPEKTEGREGFIHLCDFNGVVDRATMTYIIRNHDKKLFEQQKIKIQNAVNLIDSNYGLGTVLLDIKDQYYNMCDVVEKNFVVIEKAIEAMNNIGIKPDIKPIRGGTDGSRLSFMNLPCPNLFAGGVNYHGRYEFIATDTMKKSVELIVELSSVWAK